MLFVLTPEFPDCLTKTQNSLHISEQTAYDSQSIKGAQEGESR